MLYQPNFQQVRGYWQAFWKREVLDRPLICVTAPRDNAMVPPCDRTPTAICRHILDGTVDQLLAAYDAHVASLYFAGEAIPMLELTLGPDQYAGFLGAEIEAREGYFTTWSHPCVKDWSSFPIRIDKTPGGYFDKMKKAYETAAGLAKDRFLINMLDLHSNMDALSALRGPENLCYDLMDCPDEVEQALSAVRRTYPEVFEMAYTAGDMQSCGSIGWAPTFCQGRFAVIQCDFSCMISPAQARRFVIPAIKEEAAYLDHCVYHYDGKEALGHLDDILAIPEIDVIQWVPGAGNPRTIEWMELLHKIQAAGKGLWIYDWTPEEIKTRFKELKPEGLVFSVDAGSQKEADQLLSYVKSHF